MDFLVVTTILFYIHWVWVVELSSQRPEQLCKNLQFLLRVYEKNCTKFFNKEIVKQFFQKNFKRRFAPREILQFLQKKKIVLYRFFQKKKYMLKIYIGRS